MEIDKETGQIDVIDYVGVIDCGTPINPNLARVQAEGGIGQGIGMVLYEDVQYTDKGKIRNNSFMQYKIPNRMDIPKYGSSLRAVTKRPAHSVQIHR